MQDPQLPEELGFAVIRDDCTVVGETMEVVEFENTAAAPTSLTSARRAYMRVMVLKFEAI